jgi:hypothetical protein
MASTDAGLNKKFSCYLKMRKLTRVGLGLPLDNQHYHDSIAYAAFHNYCDCFKTLFVIKLRIEKIMKHDYL